MSFSRKIYSEWLISEGHFTCWLPEQLQSQREFKAMFPAVLTSCVFCCLWLGCKEVAWSVSVWGQSCGDWHQHEASLWPLWSQENAGDTAYTALQEAIQICDPRPAVADNPYWQLTGLLQGQTGSPLCLSPSPPFSVYVGSHICIHTVLLIRTFLLTPSLYNLFFLHMGWAAERTKWWSPTVCFTGFFLLMVLQCLVFS